MKLIFAFHNVEFAKQLKGNMEADDAAQIIDIVSSEEDLINVIAKNQEADGVLISTDIATKLGNKNLELFVDTLLAAREKFPTIVFSVLSSERMGHPIHAEMVEMGIYNIFVKDSAKLSVPVLINSFKEPHSFSSAVAHRKVDESIPWRRTINRHTTVRVEIGGNSAEEIQEAEGRHLKTVEKEEKRKLTWPEFNRKTKPKETLNEAKETEAIDWFEIEDIDTHRSTSNKVIGTVVIALGSVAPHLGTTHTAISIATSLKKRGHVVGIVEANNSQDFDRIHSLYEGENGRILSEESFSIHGIDHIKYRGENSLEELFPIYEYLVLDLGDFQLGEFDKEFKRAHIRCVLCSGHEWKNHWLENFQKKLINEQDIFFLVPNGNKALINDLKERNPGLQFMIIPYCPNPYKPTAEVNEFSNLILADFLKGYGKQYSKNALIVTGAISALVSIIIISAFLIF